MYPFGYIVGMNLLSPFEAADYLDSEETIAEFLSASMEDPNPDVFLMALRDVAKARGMADLAKATGLGRESLYKALAPGAKPRYETILRVMQGLGITLLARTAAPEVPKPLPAPRAKAVPAKKTGPPQRAGRSGAASKTKPSATARRRSRP
jgi:probable addiction module antidote protein